MTRVVWDAPGEKVFEAGVDRGVLFVGIADGVPWNGLTSVSESPSGGDVTPFYIDRVKYLNAITMEEYEATLEAYTYPDEFSQCDGTAPVLNGLYATQQPRKEFSLTYRTKIGNDVDGLDHAYKIHIVYNALASPSERNNSSVTELIDPENFSWHIYTRPPSMTGFKPTSHFVIDSRDTPSNLLYVIEDILYGSLDSISRIPTVDELLAIFTEYEASIFDADLVTDPEPYGITFDRGDTPDVISTSTIDGGAP